MNSLGCGSRAAVYDGKIAGLYDLEETLGSGHFAVVKLARHVFTGEKVAVKVIDKTRLDEVSRAHLYQEVRCMKLVQHPNVVRLYEVIDTQTKLYLILEYADGGDLYDYIMRHESGLSEDLAKEYFRQIVKAISYCHQLHVVHRDLKPENVVFFEKLGVVKLTDFGFSNKFCPGQKLETSCGSLAYSAPEILLGDSYDAPAVDIWSLGVILYMLVCGTPPFQEANDSETLTMIMDCKYTMPPHVSQECTSLIARMLVRAPENRATLKEISDDVWLHEPGTTETDGTPEDLPLVSRTQVSEENHNLIVQKMINGNIATKEEILEALDRNEYNHLTATYFLLAERKLRSHRQEQAQKRKKEDLTLPVCSSARSLPKNGGSLLVPTSVSVTNNCSNLVVPPNPVLLTVPRTPGTEGVQGGRNRKCSIVQEEDDDEDDIDNETDGLSSPLNRRGSRSEGRINIAIQDRIAEADRLKKECPTSPKLGLDSIKGVTKVSAENSIVRDRLGAAAGGGLGGRQIGDFRPKTADSVPQSLLARKMEERKQKAAATGHHFEQFNVSSKFLVDSSTISIPLPTQQTILEQTFPKYKTMPSPTRTNTILGASNLNEIFEEGTDIGSSDSATTTPRPVIRNAQITGRGQNTSTNRRTKFHKTKTTSCSSSDASDDDTENRKKRASKIVDSTKQLPQQRRDSYDDSSDSQEPGNAASSGRRPADGPGNEFIIQEGADPQDGSNQTDSNSTQSNGRQKTTQQLGFRRHRTGRRRTGETRLRESQSLNRITEVQESEPMTTAVIASKPSPVAPTKSKGFSSRLFNGFRKNDLSSSHSTSTTVVTPVDQDNDCNDKSLGADLTGSLNITEPTNTKTSSSTSKKIKMLGKYFQIHRKIWLPIPGLFHRGRLYKTQSCGSITRDRVNQSITPGQQRVIMKHPPNERNSLLFNDKNPILKNCIGGTRLLGSDGDINQNCNEQLTSSNDGEKTSSTSAVGNQYAYRYSVPNGNMPNCANLPKTTSPLHHHHLNDVPLCSSKC